ncbi:MAG: adenylate/guanylate cyclase domain-containing protein [Vicinamibacteria bacterium]|jgi:adenylate cyclase
MAEPSEDAGGEQAATIGPKLIKAMKIAREVLPGDSRYGDPLSTTGSEPRKLMARRLGEAAQERPGILKEAGLSALQVWEAVSENETSKLGDDRVAIVFTDLVGFSDWALEAGDDISLELLRAVAEAIEPPVARHRGEVVKRLGDGMMAVFGDADEAVAAVFEARERLDHVEVAGYRPRMRAGMHVGSPRRLADDYLGVDVNVAARVADGASGGEFLVSGDALEELDRDEVAARRKLKFRAKGVPSDVSAYSLKPKK